MRATRHPMQNDVFEVPLQQGLAYLRFVLEDGFADVVEVYRHRGADSPAHPCSVWDGDSIFLMYVDVQRLCRDRRAAFLTKCAEPPAQWEPRLRRQPIYRNGRIDGWIITDGREGRQVDTLDARTRRLPIWFISDSDFVVDALELSVDAAVDDHAVEAFRSGRGTTHPATQSEPLGHAAVEHDLVFRRRRDVDYALPELLRSGWEVTSTTRHDRKWFVTVRQRPSAPDTSSEEDELLAVAVRAGGDYGGRRTRVAP